MQQRQGCPQKSDWRQYLEGTLDDEAFESFSSHLSSCENCVTILDTLSESNPRWTRSPFLDEENCKRLKITPYTDRFALEDGPSDSTPTQIDHFETIRLLGEGSFGRVLLANDLRLGRQVVVKIPRFLGRISLSGIDGFLQEARKLAGLDHPNIVRVYQVGLWNDQPYIVQQYIDGGDLRQVIQNRKPSYHETARWISDVAEGVAFAHRHRIIHRDLKPSNILLDSRGRALIADFGLAIHESNQMDGIGQAVGTLPFMSPEQIRGETHRLDGRSDIWSIGVVLYRLLSGELPFRSKEPEQLQREICQRFARPPRQIDPTIPAELERIVLKCLAIRMSERYNTARDLAEELNDWIAIQASPLTTANLNPGSQMLARSPLDHETARGLMPKGLAAFDRTDQNFFLNLLPGPVARDGLPEQIKFWHSRIVPQANVRPFSVGLLYGPSGCGKTSFILAGLLPRLPSNVVTVYIQAAEGDLQTSIARELRERIPEIPSHLDLSNILFELRAGRWLAHGQRILIVLDHFEQWLQHNEITAEDGLVRALRQCDGYHCQAVVLARDDFWMRVSRFFHELEIELSERENFQPLYLFDPAHAKKVLTLFGIAYGKFNNSTELTEDQHAFLDHAVRLLNDNGRIICVHLVLFVITFKERAWTSATLSELTSIRLIGSLFLEEQLQSRRANPQARFHLEAITAVLRRLLPADDSNIKARLCDRAQLAAAACMDEQSRPFQKVIDILQNELRLIASSEPADAVDSTSSTRYYQLTHDFLVPAVRQWLSHRDSETPSGRARTRLVTLARAFEQSNDGRFVPKFVEYLAIARYVRPNQLDGASKHLFWKATQRYTAHTAIVLLVIFLLLYTWKSLQDDSRRRILSTQMKSWLDSSSQGQAISLDAFHLVRGDALDVLTDIEKEANTNEAEQVFLDLALLLLGNADDHRARRVVGSLENFSVPQLVLVRRALAQRPDFAIPLLAARIDDSVDVSLRLRSAIVLFHLGQASYLEEFLDDRTETFGFEFAVELISRERDSLADYMRFITDRIRDTPRHDALAGMVMAIAKRGIGEETHAEQSVWLDCLQTLFQNSPSAVMHSAAQFALHRQGVDTSRLEVRESAIPKDRAWFVAPHGLTFAKIRSQGALPDLDIHAWDGGPRVELQPVDSCWISTTEVPGGLFLEFLRDQNSAVAELDKHQNYKDRPASNVLFVRAMEFCNWLSDREGLTSYYTKPSSESEAWTIRSTSNGYRLPTLYESFMASYGFRRTPLPAIAANRFPQVADIYEMLNGYAWYEANTELAHNQEKQLRNCRQLLPNCIGLFDTIGNSSELTVIAKSNQIGIQQWAIESDITTSLERIVNPNLLPCFPETQPKNIGYRLVRQGM